MIKHLSKNHTNFPLKFHKILKLNLLRGSKDFNVSMGIFYYGYLNERKINKILSKIKESSYCIK